MAPSRSHAWDSPGKKTGVGCHCLLQGIFMNPGIDPTSPASPVLAGGFLTTSASWEALSVSAGVLFPNAVLAVARHEVKAALLTGPVCGCGCGEVCGCWLLVRQSASRCLSAVLPEMQAAVLRAALLAFLLRWGQSVD